MVSFSEKAIRGVLAVALFVSLAFLVASSPIIGLVPDVPPAALASIPGVGGILALLFQLSPVGFLQTLSALVVLTQCVATAASREPKAAEVLYASAVVLALGGYGWSNLDWTKAFFGFSLATGGVPNPVVVAMAVVPLAIATLYHVLLFPRHAERHYSQKGIDAEEARAARSLSASGVGALALALTLALALSTVFYVAATGVLAGASNPLSSVLFPIGAGIALVALLVAATRRKPAAQKSPDARPKPAADVTWH